MEDLSDTIIVAIISSATTILVLILTGISRYFFFLFSLTYKLKREYNFSQKKNIKLELSRSKTPLIKAAEELNYRLWNLSKNIDKGWINVERESWQDPKRYYLISTVYRFLHFIYWTLEAEKSIYSFDFAQAERDDIQYLKYIKALKHFFCESDLLKELGYDGSHPTHHFYKDNLCKYADFIRDDNNSINYMKFEAKFMTNCSEIEDVVKYMSSLENVPDNKNYNVIMVFHLFLMLFLNKYGLDYHQTDRKKFKTLIHTKYANLKIKKGILDFIKRNKIESEAKWIIEDLSL